MEASSKVAPMVPAGEGYAGFEDVEYARSIDGELPKGEGEVEDRLRMDWLLEKVAEEEAEITRVADFTNRRMEMVRKHGEAEMVRRQNRIVWLKSVIKMHLPSTGSHMEKVYGKKSLPLPHGTVGFRTNRESIVIEDAAKALRWAKANGLQVATKESVSKTPLHNYVHETGEVPPASECGWRIEPAGEAFFVTVKEVDGK